MIILSHFYCNQSGKILYYWTLMDEKHAHFFMLMYKSLWVKINESDITDRYIGNSILLVKWNRGTINVKEIENNLFCWVEVTRVMGGSIKYCAIEVCTISVLVY